MFLKYFDPSILIIIVQHEHFKFKKTKELEETRH